MPKLSLIIPIYRVEKYISRFVHSAFQQTMEDIEYIFVDDASPDKSISILKDVLEQYPDRKPHVHILRHKANRGLVEARKSGLLAAKGEYIAHVDSDDWLEKRYCEELYTFANTGGGYDLVWCDYYKDDAQNSTYCSMSHTTDKISLMKDMISGGLPSFLVLRLVKRSIYDNIENFVFPAGDMTEDMVYTLQLTNNSQKIGYLPKALYHYCSNPTSITAENSDKSVIDKFHQMVSNTKLLPKLLGEYYTTPDWQTHITAKKILCKDYLCHAVMSPQIRQLYCLTFPEVNLRFLMNRHISLNVKLRALLILSRMTCLYNLFKHIRHI